MEIMEEKKRLMNFEITDMEKAIIKEKAKSMGLNLSSYIRMCALTYPEPTDWVKK